MTPGKNTVLTHVFDMRVDPVKQYVTLPLASHA
jgi:hypothetical protein